MISQVSLIACEDDFHPEKEAHVCADILQPLNFLKHIEQRIRGKREEWTLSTINVENRSFYGISRMASQFCIFCGWLHVQDRIWVYLYG